MKSNIIKYVSKYIYLYLAIITIFIVISIFFGSFFKVNTLQIIPIYKGLNNEIFFFQLLKSNNLNTIQDSILFQNYDKFIFNNLSIPLFHIQKIILKLSNNNIQLSINIFVIIGFIISSLSSYFIFRLFNSTKTIASFFSILFSFSYFHQYDNSVINTGWYGLSLFIIYYCITLIKIDVLPKNNNFYLVLYLYCFINTLYNLQYAVIAWLLISLTVLILQFIQKKSTPKLLLILPFIYLLKIYLVYYYNLYYFEISNIPELSFSEIENSQFKITQLFLPNISHHLSIFSDLSNSYYYNYTFNNDNNVASLGFLSLFGLIFILLSSIYYSFTKKQNQYSFEGTTQAGFTLIVFLLLLTTTGSLSAFISYQNPAFIIEWFRASIFVNFICFLVLVEIFNYLFQRMHFKKFISLLIFIFLFGFYDQSPKHPEIENKQIFEQISNIQGIINYLNKDITLSSKKILILPITPISGNKQLVKRNLFIQNRLSDNIKNYQAIDENILIAMSYLDVDDQINLAKNLKLDYLVVNKKNYCAFDKLNINLKVLKDTNNFVLYDLIENNINGKTIDITRYSKYKIENSSTSCY